MICFIHFNLIKLKNILCLYLMFYFVNLYNKINLILEEIKIFFFGEEEKGREKRGRGRPSKKRRDEVVIYLL